MADTRRFSLRHSIEPTPEQPIFDDAPARLRFFTMQFLKNNFYANVAYETVADALCVPELLSAEMPIIGQWEPIWAQVSCCEWWQLFNLLEAIYRYLPHMSSGQELIYMQKLNDVFAEESIGWRMNGAGHLERQLPDAAKTQVESLFRELQAPRFSPALEHVKAAHTAYNGHPRRGREVCSEVFDALESMAKEVFSMPTATFGDVIKTMRARNVFSQETISTLEKLWVLASNHFRHGMTEPFALLEGEVEFVYLTSIGGMLMLVRHAGAVV